MSISPPTHIPYQALLLDFDGTIVDSESSLFLGWQHVFGSHNQHLDIVTWNLEIGWCSRTNQNAHDLLCRLCGRELNPDAVKAVVLEKKAALEVDLPALPGIRDLLAFCQSNNVTVGVVSSSSQQWVSSHLERLSLADQVTFLVTRESVIEHKPLPAPYLKALELLACDARCVAAVEDSAVGVASAKAAGLYTIAVPNEITAGLDLSEADLVVKSAVDVISFLGGTRDG